MLTECGEAKIEDIVWMMKGDSQNGVEAGICSDHNMS